MTPQILEWIAGAKARHIGKPKRVLEVGSLDVNGSPRPIFSDAEEYIGVDQSSGRSVDLVCSAHDLLEYFKEPFDLIMCCEMLEHDDQPLLTIRNIRSLLKKGSYLLVTSPANGFPEHRYPKDYWRLMPDAYKDIVFGGLSLIDFQTLPDPRGDPCHCSLGRKDIA
jgi:SAM-dependent methyltransferase